VGIFCALSFQYFFIFVKFMLLLNFTICWFLHIVVQRIITFTNTVLHNKMNFVIALRMNISMTVVFIMIICWIINAAWQDRI